MLSCDRSWRSYTVKRWLGNLHQTSLGSWMILYSTFQKLEFTKKGIWCFPTLLVPLMGRATNVTGDAQLLPAKMHWCMWCYDSGECMCGNLIQSSFPMVKRSIDQRIYLLETTDPILDIFATSVDVVVRKRSHWNVLPSVDGSATRFVLVQTMQQN